MGAPAPSVSYGLSGVFPLPKIGRFSGLREACHLVPRGVPCVHGPTARSQAWFLLTRLAGLRCCRFAAAKAVTLRVRRCLPAGWTGHDRCRLGSDDSLALDGESAGEIWCLG